MSVPSARFLVATGLAAAAATGLGVALRQAGDEIEVRPVAGNVHLITGPGGNVAVSVGEDGVLLVDDKFERLAPAIERAIDELAGGGVAFLVNTHWHGDHTGGNAHFGEEAVIVAHANVRRRLAGDPELGGRTAEGTPEAGLPVLTYEDGGVSIHFNGEEVRLIHAPSAHTDGDTVVWFTGSNVVHMGDLYFEVGYPFIDIESGGDPQGLVDALHRVLETTPEDARYVSGHGDVTDVEGVRTYLAMLEDVIGRVREALAEGRTADEMVADGITSDYDERWGGFDFVPPERFVSILAEGLAESL